MSVDYYSCDCCGEARYEEFGQTCPKCGRWICDNCTNEDIETPQRINEKEDITFEQYEYLCKKYGKEIIDRDVIRWGEMNPEYCPFCQGNMVHNDDLLEFILKKFNLSREEAIKLFKESKE